MGEARTSASRDRLIRGCSGTGGIFWAVTLVFGVEANVRSASLNFIFSYHRKRTLSTGNTPANAPHSVVILEMVRRSSTVSPDTPSPVNSIAALRTSSLLNDPHRATMTSLPVTAGDNRPVNSTLTIRGICHHVLPVAQIDAASVRTIGVPTQPTPPYILL